MNRGLILVQIIVGFVLLAAVLLLGTMLVNPAWLLDQLAPGAQFSWENFNPLSSEPGLFGLSPLIWSALVVAPLCVGLPALVYYTEKKKVPRVTRTLLWQARAAVLALIYLLAAGPALSTSEVETKGSKIAVLIDDSMSMGADSREFTIFSALDDADGAEVRKLRTELEALGIQVGKPQPQGFVTVSPEERLVRGFVRDVVRQRATRLLKKLQEVHGGPFQLAPLQTLQTDVELLSAQADLKQSELTHEQIKEKPDEGRLRLLSGELANLKGRITSALTRYDQLLRPASGLDVVKTARDHGLSPIATGDRELTEAERDQVLRHYLDAKRILLENLLHTCHAEGPRRWDIACELVAPGNTLAVPADSKLSLLDLQQERARKYATEDARGEVRQAMPVLRYFVFSTRFGRDQITEEAILEVTPSQLDFRAPMGRLTELDKAMAEVRRYYSDDDDLSCVMVITDGRDTGASGADLIDTAARREADAAAAGRKAGRAVEVVTVSIGNPKPVKVLELLSISGDREILKDDFLELKLKIRADKAYRADPAKGKLGQKVKIILCEDSFASTSAIPYDELNGGPALNEESRHIFLGTEEITEARIRFKPKTAGRHVYFVKLNEDRLVDEDTYRNNYKEHYVEVIDRKIKVLYIEQSPRWQWRALNEALKRDKKLEYQGFLIDAQEGWTQPTSIYDEEVKKKVKPLRATFYDANLGRVIRDKDQFFAQNYDVIILGDIDPDSPSFRLEHWKWIEEWVSRQRGGLMLLAGQSYNPSKYGSIEQAKVLFPVELEFPSDYDKTVNVQQMKFFRLSPAGRAHEVHRLSGKLSRNDELWGSLQDGNFVRGQLNGFYWYQPTGGIRPAPAVALSHVAREGRQTGEGEVLTAAMPHGTGMVFYCGTDDTWLMRETVGDTYFYRYWQNALRFVASRRLAAKQERVDVYTDKAEYQVGEDVKVYVELLGNNLEIYEVIKQNQQKELNELPRSSDPDDKTRLMLVDIQGRSGGRLTEKRLVLSEVSWNPGLWEGTVPANDAGTYDVWVRSYDESMKRPHRYIVKAPAAELRDLSMDLPGNIARATELPASVEPLEYQEGKRAYLMTDMGRAALEVRERTNELPGFTSLLWDRKDDRYTLRSLLLLLLVLLLAGEWLTRKIVRMV